MTPRATTMTIEYQNIAEQRRATACRVSRKTLKTATVLFLVCAGAFGCAVSYSFGHSNGYNTSQRESAKTAVLRDVVLATPASDPSK